MGRSHDEHIDDLRTQVAELRAVNAELARALVAANAGTPLRSSITAALTLSRIEDAEQTAAIALTEREAAVAERDAASKALQDVQCALAEQTAAAARLSDETAAQRRAIELAGAERDSARASLASATAELEQLRTMLTRRSVRAAQQAARLAAPVVENARRLRERHEAAPTDTR